MMQPVSPVFTDLELPEVKVGEGQPGVIPLPVVYLYDRRCAVSRWSLNDSEAEVLQRTNRLRFFKWWKGSQPQPALLSVDAPNPKSEPCPALWSHQVTKERDVLLCFARLEVFQTQWVLSQGYIYMLVWNVRQSLMPTCLEVDYVGESAPGVENIPEATAVVRR